jgi:hypothetical protein
MALNRPGTARTVRYVDSEASVDPPIQAPTAAACRPPPLQRTLSFRCPRMNWISGNLELTGLAQTLGQL